MKVLLVKDVKKVGKAGEIKDLTEGYVRNFLLPQKLVTLVTADAVARHQASLDKQVRERQRQAQLYKKLVAKINAMTLQFSSSANVSGVLYGAITAAHIKEQLHMMGVPLSEHQIILTSPIKVVGIHRVTIALDHDHRAIVKVVVTQDNEH